MDFNPQQQHSLLSKMGYTGPADPKMMDAFLSSNPGAAARMGKFSRAAKKIGMAQGGTVSGYAAGGFTVKASGGRPDERTYTVVDSSGKVVFGPTPNKTAADNEAKRLNTTTTPTTTTTTPATTTPTPTAPTTGATTTSTPGTSTNPAPTTTTGGGFTVKSSGGRPDERTYTVVDSAGKVVFGPTPNKTAADAQAARRNGTASTTGTTTGTTAGTTTGTTAGTTTGTTTGTTPTTPTAPTKSEGTTLAETLIQTPEALTTEANVANITATPDTLLAAGTGQVGAPTTAATTTTGPVSTAAAPTPTPAAIMEAATVAPQVSAAVSGVQGAQGEVSDEATVEAAQQTESSISNMEAAQGEAFLMNNPVQREIEAGELVSGSAVDAAKVDKLMSTVQAAEATPSQKATVQGQLSELMTQFEGGKTPAWAAGAMRNAQAMLAQRGLGASSIAGQAIIQAAMESALPVAQADAATFAQFEAQNLSNRQQTALFAAQQRAAFLQQDFDQAFQTRVLNAAKISDIANMNFTAEQNIALENSRAVNTMNLANLDARQGMVMAQAAALSQLDITNLNNRQQAAVQNAQAFLQMDMANLDNRQQAEMFRAQSIVQSLFTDQAAENAARQFNAASKNQTDQFFADLGSRVSMFNSEQKNAMAQFNAGEANATARFNAQLEAARKQFNSANALVVAQANAQWRQNISTINTAAQNEANLEKAKTMNALTAKAMDEIWQRERDTLAYTFTALESDEDRALELLLQDKKTDMVKWEARQAEKTAKYSAIRKLILGW